MLSRPGLPRAAGGEAASKRSPPMDRTGSEPSRDRRLHRATARRSLQQPTRVTPRLARPHGRVVRVPWVRAGHVRDEPSEAAGRQVHDADSGRAFDTRGSLVVPFPRGHAPARAGGVDVRRSGGPGPTRRPRVPDREELLRARGRRAVAILDILGLVDFRGFLEASGYAERLKARPPSRAGRNLSFASSNSSRTASFAPSRAARSRSRAVSFRAPSRPRPT